MFQRFMTLYQNDANDENDDNEIEVGDLEGGTGSHHGSSDGNDGIKEQILLTPMEVALMAIDHLLRLRIRNVATTRTGKRDGVGVLLYGCDPLRGRGGRAKDNEDNFDSDDPEHLHFQKVFPSTHELVQLAPPGIEQVLTLQECTPTIKQKSFQKQKRNLEREFCFRNCENDDGKNASRKEGGNGGAVAFSLRSALHEANKIFMNAK